MGHVIVIGGSIMGSSFAYHMAMAVHAGSLRVIEPDPTYALAAAPRSVAGSRVSWKASIAPHSRPALG